jgi:hypothetical protein
MTAPTLGRLISVSIREVWAHEAKDFTPWLAEPDNLSLLAETLQLGDIQVQGTEVPVGNFFIDILARDIEGRIVVIENQFGPTDHTHLGQILTYVAGQDGQATVIWIAETIREEHRAAIDWLNASTIEGFDFFAVEVEALRIGASPPAPWFNVVAKPNSWSRGVGRATRSMSGGQLDERAKAYIAYWSAFGAFLKDKDAPYRISTTPRDYWCSFRTRRKGFLLVVTAGFRDRRLGVEIYINDPAAKAAFDLLETERQDIEKVFGTKLDWQRMEGKKACRIAVYPTDMDLNAEEQRTRQYEWFLDQCDASRAPLQTRSENCPWIIRRSKPTWSRTPLRLLTKCWPSGPENEGPDYRRALGQHDRRREKDLGNALAQHCSAWTHCADQKGIEGGRWGRRSDWHYAQAVTIPSQSERQQASGATERNRRRFQMEYRLGAGARTTAAPAGPVPLPVRRCHLG